MNITIYLGISNRHVWLAIERTLRINDGIFLLLKKRNIHIKITLFLKIGQFRTRRWSLHIEVTREHFSMDTFWWFLFEKYIFFSFYHIIGGKSWGFKRYFLVKFVEIICWPIFHNQLEYVLMSTCLFKCLFFPTFLITIYDVMDNSGTSFLQSQNIYTELEVFCTHIPYIWSVYLLCFLTIF